MKNVIIPVLIGGILVAGGIASKNYHKPVPAAKTVQSEVIVPLKPVAVPTGVAKPRAAVTTKAPKKSAAQKSGKKVTKTELKDFAADLRALQNCKKLKALHDAGKRPANPYEEKLQGALIPWYMRNCLFS